MSQALKTAVARQRMLLHGCLDVWLGVGETCAGIPAAKVSAGGA